MTTAPTLDPRIARFAREAMAEMSTAQAASILGISRDSVVELCRSGQLVAWELGDARRKSMQEAATRFQAEHPGEPLPARLQDAALYEATKRTSKRLTLTAAALLRYILDSTVGDKSLTLEAIQTHCPAWHAKALQWAQRVPTTPAQSTPSTAATRSKAKRVENVIPFEHPELFQEFAPAPKAVA